MRLSPFHATILFCICFSLYFTFQQRLLVSGISPFQLNAMTYFIASLALGGYLFAKDKSALHIRSKKGLFLGSLVGISIAVIADTLVLFGLKSGTSITWSLLACLTPITTYLLAIPFLRESAKVHKIAGVLISVVGAALVIYVPKVGIDFQHGVLFFVGAIVFFGIGNILSQLALEHISPMQLTLVKLVSTAIILVTLWPFLGLPFVSVNWIILVLNSLIMLSANILVNYVIGKAGATYFAIGSNMSPLFVSLLSILVVGTWPTYLQVLGGVVIVGSILLFQYKKKIHQSEELPQK